MIRDRFPASARRLRGQWGATLIEALVALLVMGFGMLAIAGINAKLRHSGDFAKQRGEASQLARSELERLRGFVALTRDPSLHPSALVFDEIVDGTWDVAGTSTTYSVSRVVSQAPAGARVVRVAVSWLDRRSTDSNSPNKLQYEMLLPAEDPKLVASLYAPPENQVSQRRPLDRHPAIPVRARSLDTTVSVFKPLASGTVAWVFNNISGVLTGVCAVSAASTHASLTLADVASCVNNQGSGSYLLRGQVRFSLSSPPNSATPNDPVQALGVDIVLDSTVHSGSPECVVDNSENLAAGIQAVDYYCRIPAREPSVGDAELYWSGTANLTGLSLVAGGYRVCRYSADYDGNGSIENAEHPARYVRLNTSLGQQNFLVVRFEEACPVGQAVDLDAGVVTNTATAAHQP